MKNISKNEMIEMIMEAILERCAPAKREAETIEVDVVDVPVVEEEEKIQEENTPEQYQSVQKGKERAEVPKSAYNAAASVDTGLVKIAKGAEGDSEGSGEGSGDGADGGGADGGGGGIDEHAEGLEEVTYKTDCASKDKLTKPEGEAVSACKSATATSKSGSKVKGRDEYREKDGIQVGGNLFEEVLAILEEEMEEGMADLFRRNKPEKTDQEKRLASIQAKKRAERTKQSKGMKGMYKKPKREIDIGTVSGVSGETPGGIKHGQAVQRKEEPKGSRKRKIVLNQEGDKE